MIFIFDIAGVVFRCTLQNLNTNILVKLEKRYKPFLSEFDNKYQGEICITYDPKFAKIRKQFAPGVIVYEKNNTLYVSSLLFEGTVSLHSYKAHFVCRGWRRDVNAILRLFLSVLLLKKKYLQLHASAIKKDGLAYVFIGRQGAGKTTITRLSGLPIIADDTVILRKTRDSLFACTSPFDPKHKNAQRLIVPLGQCILVSHADQSDEMCSLTKERTVSLLFAHTRPDMKFYQHAPVLAAQAFDTIFQIFSASVIIKQLDFSFSKRFLDLLVRE